jgi:ketosteroid isomerase-like protein
MSAEDNRKVALHFVESHDLLEIRDGKIVAGREYLDTAHAQTVIVESATAAAASSRQ